MFVGPIPDIGTLGIDGGTGVAVGAAQVQLLDSTQLGFRQKPLLQVMVDGHCESPVQTLLQDNGGVGVTVRVAVGTAQVQSLSVIQLGFRQKPFEQVKVDGHPASPVHVLLHWGGGVGVFEGVLLGVLDRTGDGVGDFTAIEKTNLHAGATACGVSWGTVGATVVLFSSLIDVRYAITPIPAVMKVTNTRYQYFFRNDIPIYFQTPLS